MNFLIIKLSYIIFVSKLAFMNININSFLLLLFIYIEYTNAKLIGGSTLRTMYINDKIKEQHHTIIELEDSNQKLNNYITLKNCPLGQVFNTKDYSCTKCQKKFYRTNDNTTCIHCPEGFFSNEGNDMCTVINDDCRVSLLANCSESPSNSTNIHTLCPNNNKFATLGSCVKCNPEKKEYMPYNSNQDKCIECPSGSIVNQYSTTCTPCSSGYYEKNNTCIECPIGTYSDNIGTSICNVCNNKKSFAYMTSGGNNCNNSIFYNIFYNIEYIGDNINPIVAKIYNHRKEIFDITCSTIIVYGLLLFFNQ